MPMILWSKLKTYLRMNPCGAACACAAPAANSWVAMLLLLRLPCGQPSVEFVLAHNLKHAVHFVMTRPGTASCLKRMEGTKKLWITSCARRMTSTSWFTGTNMVLVTTSSLDAGSVVSRPSAPSPPEDASSSSGFVVPNFPSGPGYRKYHANCMPVTSTRTAPGSAGRNRSEAQMELLIRFNPTNNTAVSTVQTISMVTLPWEYCTSRAPLRSRYIHTSAPSDNCAATNTMPMRM